MLRPTVKARFRNILFLLVVGGFLLVWSSKRKHAYDFYDDSFEPEQGLNEQQQIHDSPAHPVHPPPPPLPLPLIPAADTSNAPNSEVLGLTPDPDPEEQKYGHYCPPLKCAQGHWIPRVPQFTTYEEAHKAIIYNPNDPGYSLPDPRPVIKKVVDDQGKVTTTVVKAEEEMTEEEKEENGKERVLEMSNWVWKSDFGDMVPFDTEEFVIRLLRSPGGLFLIGDSLTTQHFMTLRYRLLQSSFFLHEDLPHWPLHSHPHVHQYGLDTNHPNTHALLSRTNPPIPLSRAQRPIITHIVDQTLVGPRELNRFFRTDPGYVHGHKYTNVEGWIGFLEEMTRPRVREGEEEGVNEDSLVVITSGAHWSRAGLHGYSPTHLPPSTSRARIEHAYTQMVKLIVPSLSPLPRTTIFFRTISPGHPSCTQLRRPFTSMRGEVRGKEGEGEEGGGVEEYFRKEENRNPDVVEWDWDGFVGRNGVWEREIEGYERERGSELWGETKQGEEVDEGRGGRGAKWVYLDFWEMDLQRGDAHTLTGVGKGRWDCLHYAMPYLHNQWTDSIWHYLAVDGRIEKEKQKLEQERIQKAEEEEERRERRERRVGMVELHEE
ncbi:hypothetical protein K435DRAFT_843009 [Dendrothele bispora CBS 962.96]|uniref:Uncharacterized protein n=1 Tax=Dendrothele bispora (strain CBS 962.96) TaxID=1314807 RepID=A0A4S8LBP0_DENBC|nr:hypothetical protein K435DRAFT_843009 [Dendrothele bispora CBS 962.96]